MSKRRITAVLIALLSVFLQLSFIGETLADKEDPMDIMIVLDNSGSMRKNDPKLLTKKVVADFLEGLSQNSQVGIIIFDEKANLGVPLSSLSSEETRQSVLASLEAVTYRGQWTDSPAGIERALYELKSKGRENVPKTIIFMTDGIVDTGDKARDLERAKWLREDLAAESQRHHVRIFGIAFTEDADFQLIQALGEKTGGGYFRALSADEIEKIFKEIDATIKQPQAAVEAAPQATKATDGMNSKIWLIVALGIVILGIVAIVVGRGKKGKEDFSDKPYGMPAGTPLRMPKTTLKDIREVSGKHEHPINKAVMSIGRASSNDVVINLPTVSTRHATIEYREGVFYLTDQRSTNGTFLNGKRIDGSERLKHGDRIKFDENEFIFVLEDYADEVKTQLRGKVDLPASQIKKSAQEKDEAPTLLKDMCPNHPAWKATELCPICKKAYCANCMVEKDGRKICVTCAQSKT